MNQIDILQKRNRCLQDWYKQYYRYNKNIGPNTLGQIQNKISNLENTVKTVVDHITSLDEMNIKTLVYNLPNLDKTGILNLATDLVNLDVSANGMEEVIKNMVQI